MLQAHASPQLRPKHNSAKQQPGAHPDGVGVGVGVTVGVTVGVGVGDPPGVWVGVGVKQKSILSNFDIDAADIPSTAPISLQEILFMFVNDAILCYCYPIL